MMTERKQIWVKFLPESYVVRFIDKNNSIQSYNLPKLYPLLLHLISLISCALPLCPSFALLSPSKTPTVPQCLVHTFGLYHCYLEQHSIWNGKQKRKWKQGTQPRLTQERLGTRYIMHKKYIWNKIKLKWFFSLRKCL